MSIERVFIANLTTQNQNLGEKINNRIKVEEFADQKILQLVLCLSREGSDFSMEDLKSIESSWVEFVPISYIGFTHKFLVSGRELILSYSRSGFSRRSE